MIVIDFRFLPFGIRNPIKINTYNCSIKKREDILNGSVENLNVGGHLKMLKNVA